MKKSTIVSMFLFWAVIVSVLTAGLVFSEKKPATKSNQPILGVNKIENNSSSDIKLTIAEIAKHNLENDCWMIISNKVYNFSSYLNSHPGGAGTITPYCGKDGTNAFFGKPHSEYAQSLLPDYFIGDLNSIIPGKKSGSSSPASTSQKPPTPVKTVAVPPTPTAITQTSQGGSITTADVAKHSLAGDCWMIVSGKVYNVTSYVGSHPGGTGTISSYCGKDATSAFYGLPHSQNAANILSSFYIGDLAGSSAQGSSGSVQTNGQPAFQAPVQVSSTSRHEDDD